ncbi:hypothetical protein Y032_0081g1479 [Ancylostoma ceylanicum]|uniref:Uncharacterized protein n=1 Tax=Ancylostoma ceylanicum TaxID=53326 RepID=A0A016TTB8_9BILA|nr:hypothetical protein Y032_0081g1479 [Ancylostoma ceylanicum]
MRTRTWRDPRTSPILATTSSKRFTAVLSCPTIHVSALVCLFTTRRVEDKKDSVRRTVELHASSKRPVLIYWKSNNQREVSV